MIQKWAALPEISDEKNGRLKAQEDCDKNSTCRLSNGPSG